MTFPPFSDELAPALPVPTPPSAPEVPVDFPVLWMLRNAPAAIQYRSLTELAKLSPLPGHAPSLAYGFAPALRLAIRQGGNGTWNNRMLSVPGGGSDPYGEVGTMPAVRRLLELGWERDAPSLLSARRILFRLLAEDEDASYLFELASEAPADDPELVSRGRLILREAAAATLAQCGYEHDPRLRGCAHRILTRVGEFLASPLARKPWIRVGNRHLLSAEASPPSMSLLHMLAFMPHYRSEHYDFMELLYESVSRPLPRQEVFQQVGTHVLRQSHFVLGDPLATRNVADADIPFALYWLELVARLGFLRRSENWTRLFDRFLDERGRDGVWRPGKGVESLATTSAHAWPAYAVDREGGGDAIAAEVTFRLALIARLSGRAITLV